MSKREKPKHFLLFKIVGILGAVLFIFALTMIFTGFGNFDSNRFMIGTMLLPFSFFMVGIGVIIGFRPEIAKLRTQSTRYIQQENKEELSRIADDAADIMSGAITKATHAVKEGLQDSIFCKHCGAEIDADSVFCSKCGKKQ